MTYKKIRNFIMIFSFLYCLAACDDASEDAVDYKTYHNKRGVAEAFIGKEEYKEALQLYERIFDDYDFIFLRDYKIASQLCFLIGDKEKGLVYIEKAISNGWELGSLKEHRFLQKHLTNADWQYIERKYENLHHQYLKSRDSTLKSSVRAMFEKDQSIAYKASIIEDEQAQETFIKENFPKHSEDQLIQLLEILDNQGYPGELLIGNDFWVSTILSHHNSQDLDYVRKDTLYNFIKPKLMQYLRKGFISPYEIALAEDWKQTVLSDWNDSPYGYLSPPNTSTIARVNKTRSAIGLRSVQLRNKLVDIETKTGMLLYLPDWVEGKIPIEKN